MKQATHSGYKRAAAIVACLPVNNSGWNYFHCLYAGDTSAEHDDTCLSEAGEEAHGQNCSLYTPVRFCCRSISLTAAELAQWGDMISLWNISEASTLRSC